MTLVPRYRASVAPGAARSVCCAFCDDPAASSIAGEPLCARHRDRVEAIRRDAEAGRHAREERTRLVRRVPKGPAAPLRTKVYRPVPVKGCATCGGRVPPRPAGKPGPQRKYCDACEPAHTRRNRRARGRAA